MARIRQGCNVAIGAALAIALFASCKKDDKAGTSSGDQAGDKGGAASEDLSLLPADADVVIGINFDQIQHSPLYKKFIEPLMKAGPMQRQMNDVIGQCGYDPMTAVKSAVVGIKGAGGNKPIVVTVAHGLDKAKVLDCADKARDQLAKNNVELTHSGDIVTLKGNRGQIAFNFTSDSTMVALVSDTADASAVKAIAAGGSALKTSSPFAEMYKKVKTGDSVWVVAHGKVLDDLPVPAAAAYGSLNVSDGLTVDGRMQFDSPGAAKQAAELITNQGKQAAGYIDKLEATADDKEVHASAVVSSQKLQSLMPLLTMALAGFGQ
jgi:hypothetical protein